MTNKSAIAIFNRRSVWAWVLLFAIPTSVLGYLTGASAIDANRRRNNPEIFEFSDNLIRSQYTISQYRNASYTNAKSALQSYLDFLSTRNSNSIIYSLELCQFYKMLTFARLAKVEERQKNAALAEQAWQHAELLASQIHLKDITRKHIELLLNQDDTYYGYFRN